MISAKRRDSIVDMHEAVASLDATRTKEDNRMIDQLKECPRCGRGDLTAYLSGKAGQELMITSYSCPDCGPVKPGTPGRWQS